MRASSAAIVAAFGLASAQVAPVVLENPVGPLYKATLEGDITGYILATAVEGEGVVFRVNFANMDPAAGPFGYHLHEKPIPLDQPGNCTATGGHLNPYLSTDCSVETPEICEVGDLSGKHGKAEGESYSHDYFDVFASTDPSSPAFFGDLSFVLHDSEGARIACANFVEISSPVTSAGDCTAPPSTSAEPAPTTASSEIGTTVVTPTSPPTAPTVPIAGASTVRLSSSALCLALAAIVLAF